MTMWCSRRRCRVLRIGGESGGGGGGIDRLLLSVHRGVSVRSLSLRLSVRMLLLLLLDGLLMRQGGESLLLLRLQDAGSGRRRRRSRITPAWSCLRVQQVVVRHAAANGGYGLVVRRLRYAAACGGPTREEDRRQLWKSWCPVSGVSRSMGSAQGDADSAQSSIWSVPGPARPRRGAVRESCERPQRGEYMCRSVSRI